MSLFVTARMDIATTELPARLLEMRATRPLRRNFRWAMSGQAVYAGCQWAMLMVIAKLGTPAMVGQFALAFAVTGPVFMFANLQLRAVMATDTRPQCLFQQYLALQVVATAMGLSITALILRFSHYSNEISWIIIAAAVAKSIETFSEICYGALQQRDQVDKVGVGMMVKGPLALLLLSIGIAYTSKVLWGVAGIAAAWLTVFTLLDTRFLASTLVRRGEMKPARRLSWLCSLLRPSFRERAWVRVGILTLPLGAVSMLVSLNSSIPRYFVETAWGSKELGLFSALLYLSLAGNIVVQAFGSSTSTRLAEYYSAGEESQFLSLVLRLVGYTATLSGAGVVFAIWAGRPLLTILYRPEYAGQAKLLPWIVLATGIACISQILSFALIAARMLWVQVPLFLASAALLTCCCASLVPQHASMGATFSMIIGNTALAAGCALVLSRAMNRTRNSTLLEKIP